MGSCLSTQPGLERLDSELESLTKKSEIDRLEEFQLFYILKYFIKKCKLKNKYLTDISKIIINYCGSIKTTNLNITYPKCKIAIMGLSCGTGKTNLAVRCIWRKYNSNFECTIEHFYHKTIQVDGMGIKIEILDTSGHKEYFELHEQYFSDCNAFMFVYSICGKKSSFDNLEEFLFKKLMRYKNVNSFNRIPVILVGNKCDLEVKREVKTEYGQKLAKKYNIPFFETSTKCNINVDKVFEQIVREYRIKCLR